MGRTDAPLRWEGIPIGVRGLGRESWARLDHQVARFQQARRQLCLPGDAADAVREIVPGRAMQREAEAWASWMLAGRTGVLTWYRRALANVPAEGSWQREQRFFGEFQAREAPDPLPTASGLWRWRRGLDLRPWLGAAAGQVTLQVPVRLHQWADAGIQPVLGQWLFWGDEWLIHLVFPVAVPESRGVPRVAIVLLVPPLVAPTSAAYRVSQGDTLWSISTRHTGAGALWSQIYQQNRRRISHPHWIYPGQILALPVPARGESLVIRPGDTLWVLARTHTGHASWWPELWRANRDRVHSPRRLLVGTTLRWPPSWPPPVWQAAARPEPRSLPKRAEPTRFTALKQPPVGRLPKVASSTPKPRMSPRRLSAPPPAQFRDEVRWIPPVPPPSPSEPPPLATPEPVETGVPEERVEAPSVPPDGMAPAPGPAGETAVPLNRVRPPEPPLPASGSTSSAGPVTAAQPVELRRPAVIAMPSPPVPADPAEPPEAESVQPARREEGPEPETVPPAAERSPEAGLPDSDVPSESVPPPLPATPPEPQARLQPATGGIDPWDDWLHPERQHPERPAAVSLPAAAPAVLWPRLGVQAVPDYLVETAKDQPRLQGWYLNRHSCVAFSPPVAKRQWTKDALPPRTAHHLG